MKTTALGILLIAGTVLAPLAAAEDGEPDPCAPYQAVELQPVIVQDRSNGIWVFAGVPQDPTVAQPGETLEYEGMWAPVLCEDDPIPPGNGDPEP